MELSVAIQFTIYPTFSLFFTSTKLQFEEFHHNTFNIKKYYELCLVKSDSSSQHKCEVAPFNLKDPSNIASS